MVRKPCGVGRHRWRRIFGSFVRLARIPTGALASGPKISVNTSRLLRSEVTKKRDAVYLFRPLFQSRPATIRALDANHA
jgi:hypothetical protein